MLYLTSHTAYYISPYLSVCVCLSAFFSATAEVFSLKIGMVFRIDAGQILKPFGGPRVEYLPSYGRTGALRRRETETKRRENTMP